MTLGSFEMNLVSLKPPAAHIFDTLGMSSIIIIKIIIIMIITIMIIIIIITIMIINYLFKVGVADSTRLINANHD